VTDQTAPAATVTVLEQRTELRVTGVPDVRNRHGGGHIRPTEVTLLHQAHGVRAQVYGRWVRGDGQCTDAPVSQNYWAHGTDMGDWPVWLADLARDHTPPSGALTPNTPTASRGAAV
jgi:hypothetical protein